MAKVEGIEVSVERQGFWGWWRSKSKHVLAEGEPLEVRVGGSRLRIDWRTGWEPLGNARPREPWVRMILLAGGGVEARLFGDSTKPVETNFIAPSPDPDEVDVLSTSYRRIELRAPSVSGERVVINNPGALHRDYGLFVEDELEVWETLTVWDRRVLENMGLLRTPRCR